MKKTATISEIQYERLRKNPVFFLKLFEYTFYNKNGEEIDNSTWRSLDRDLNISIKAGNFANRNLGYCLCVIDDAVKKKNQNGNEIPDAISITFHSVSGNNVNEWVYIINCFNIRSQDKNDKFAFTELLWALDKLRWDVRTLTLAISKYPTETISSLINRFQDFGRILSCQKQGDLQRVCMENNGQFDKFFSKNLKQAYDCVPNTTERRKPNYEYLNYYRIIDIILNSSNLDDEAENIAISNPLIKLHSWFHHESPLDDYDILYKYFRSMSDEYRLMFVKRYLHDIRNKKTSLDISFLQSLRDVCNDRLIRFRCSLESPGEPIILTLPLLLDTLITLYNSNGKSFQSFNGVLDIAITHCDTVRPVITFKLERLMPSCNNGAVYNKDKFKGFVDYSLIRKLNEDLITDDHLRSTFICLMDKYAQKQTFPVCKFGDGSQIPDEIYAHCSQQRKLYSEVNGDFQDATDHLQCYQHLQHEDKWVIIHDNLKYIKDYLKEEDLQYSKEYSISIDMLSLDKLRSYILSLPKKYEILENDEFLIHSYSRKTVNEIFDLYLVQEYTEILRMRVFPQEGALVGRRFDVFGFRKEIIKSLSQEQLRKNNREQLKVIDEKLIALESQEVRKRCIDSLKRELNADFINDSYFELPYNRTLLSDTLKLFYHKGSFNDKDEMSNHEFLTQLDTYSNFVQFCAPQLSEVKNPAIDLPYFWCRGRECFQNNLWRQTLEEESNWRNYTLYHMSEILGLPLLHKTEAGYEPEKSVWQFIGVINKVMQKFKRLKCRSCGHLMFTDKTKTFGFNRFNFFACANPACTEVSKSVYLNFCFKCKKGLIDSRDSQKCPNGWYICPTCLACCDDEQYERQAQRYILSKRPVPSKIEEKRGKGHNDKDIYFCPTCGHQIESVKNEHGETFWGCPVCHKKF